MAMKLINIYVLVALVVLTSCSESFVEEIENEQENVENPTKDDETDPQVPPVTPPGEQTGDTEWEVSDYLDLTAEEKRAAAIANQFEENLMDKVSEISQGKNIAVSPLSMTLFLNMAGSLASEATKAELYKGIGVTDIAAHDEYCSKQLHFLPSETCGVKAMINNGVWLSEKFTPKDGIDKLLLNNFQTDIKKVDFTKKQTFIDINQWADDVSNGLIKWIVDMSVWESFRDAHVLCANAIYLNAKWRKEFDPGLTTKQKFYGTTHTSSVDMMHNEITTLHSVNEKAEMVTLEYSGGSYVLEIFMPKVGDLSAITQEVRKDLRQNAGFKTVDLRLPSFTSQSRLTCNDLLSEMGLSVVNWFKFEELGIDIADKMFVDQFAAIIINEKGTEMAAITGGMAGANGDEENQYASVTFDHPFMYVIRHVRSGATIMAGTINDL